MIGDFLNILHVHSAARYQFRSRLICGSLKRDNTFIGIGNRCNRHSRLQRLKRGIGIQKIGRGSAHIVRFLKGFVEHLLCVIDHKLQLADLIGKSLDHLILLSKAFLEHIVDAASLLLILTEHIASSGKKIV